MALPQNRRNGPERDEVDVDALFASEPDAADEPVRPGAPKLIFTQPADRNVQQFADEPVQFAEETVQFVDEVDPLSLPLLSPPSPPYHARWNEPGPPRRLGIALAFLAVLGAIGVGTVVLVPRYAPDLWARAAAVGLVRPGVPPAAVTPEAAGPAPVASTIPPPLPAPTLDPIVPAPSAAAPVSRLESQKPVTHPPQPSPVLREAPKAVSREKPRVAATSGRVASAEPPVSTRGVTSGPPAPAAPTAPPTVDVRPASDGPVVLGQPLTAPRAVATAPLMRDASPAPRPDPPSIAAGPAPVPSAPAPNAGLDPRAETDRVRAVLTGYERAYSALDADAASRVFPTVDRKALSRAFSGLSAQQIQFDDCRIQVQQASARATCAGTARWTPKVGGGSQQQTRRWEFALQQASTGWKIGSVRVQ